MTTGKIRKVRVVDEKSSQVSAGVGDQEGRIERIMDIGIDIAEQILVEECGQWGKWEMSVDNGVFFFNIRTNMCGIYERMGNGEMPHFGNRAGQVS